MPSFRHATPAATLLAVVAFTGAAQGADPRLECPSGAKVVGHRPRPRPGAEPLDATANYAVAFQEVCQSKDPDGRLVFNGPAMAYYPDGTPMCRAEYAWGEPAGTWTCWYVGGAVRSEQHFGGPGELAWSVDYYQTGAAVRKTYRDGRVEKEQHVDPSGEIVEVAQYDRSGAVVKQAGVEPEGDNLGASTAVGGGDGAAPQTPETGKAARPAPAVALLVTGFSPPNADAIRAQERVLDQRLAFLGDSSGVTVEVALAAGSEGAVVTVEERMSGSLDGLGFLPGVNVGGHRPLNLTRAMGTAEAINAWVGIDLSSRVDDMALAEALGKRAFVVRYVNDEGLMLAVPYVPAPDRRVSFLGAVTVAKQGRVVAAVDVDSSMWLLPLPVGADGKPTAAAAVYQFFGVTP